MRTVHSPEDRAALTRRIGQLSADSRPKWGKFDLSRMLAHANDAVRMATGELPVRVASLERFAQLEQVRAWPSHPVFGALDAKGWGALVYKHCDHHLRQFGR